MAATRWWRVEKNDEQLDMEVLYGKEEKEWTQLGGREFLVRVHLRSYTGNTKYNLSTKRTTTNEIQWITNSITVVVLHGASSPGLYSIVARCALPSSYFETMWKLMKNQNRSEKKKQQRIYISISSRDFQGNFILSILFRRCSTRSTVAWLNRLEERKTKIFHRMKSPQ